MASRALRGAAGAGGRGGAPGLSQENFSHDVSGGLEDQGFFAFLPGHALLLGGLVALLGEVDPGLHLGEVWHRVI